MSGSDDRYGKCESCETLGQLQFINSRGERFSWTCMQCRAKSGHRLDPVEIDLFQAEVFTSERMLRVARIENSLSIPEPIAGDANGQTILVIEDDADTRNAACDVLGVAGFAALAVGNGREALELLAKLDTKPHLILLDLAMPIMNGWDFYDYMSRDRELRSIPVIVLTACDLVGNVPSLKWLRKPIGMDTLLEAVRESCAN